MHAGDGDSAGCGGNENLKRKIVLGFCSIILFLSVLPVAVSQEPSPSGDISFMPNVIPETSVTFVNSSFVFDWLGNHFEVAMFLSVNETEFELELEEEGKIKLKLKIEDDPEIEYDYDAEWENVTEKSVNNVIWGLNIWNIPDEIANYTDSFSFKIVKANFNLSKIELENVEFLEEGYNITRLHLPDNLVLSYEDLQVYGYDVEVSELECKVFGVKGKTVWNLDPITYSSPIITVVGETGKGDTEVNAYNFWDVWNASNVNGWDIVQMSFTSENVSFDFGARLQIGDASTPTWFADTEKQVTFNSTVLSANSQILIDVKNNGHFRVGQVLDATDKLSYKGCQFTALDSYLYVAWVKNRAGGDTQIYSSSFTQVDKGNFKDHSFGNDDATEMPFWNNIIDHGLIGGKWDISHTIWQYGYTVISYTTTGDFRDSFIFKPYHAFYFYSWYGDAPIKNVIVRQCRNKVFRCYAVTIAKYLVNFDVDTWSFYWLETSIGEIYRQYEFDLTVTYPNGTAIQNANVTIKHYGQGETQDFTELTDSNGHISTKTLTKGFYNQTGGDTMYSLEPFNLQITNITDYQTYNGNFTLPEKKGWIIALTTDIEDDTYVWWTLSLCWIPVAIALLIVAQKRRLRAERTRNNS